MSPPGTVPLGVTETTHHAANHARRWWILAVLGVAQLMVILDSTNSCANTTNSLATGAARG